MIIEKTVMVKNKNKDKIFSLIGINVNSGFPALGYGREFRLLESMATKKMNSD